MSLIGKLFLNYSANFDTETFFGVIILCVWDAALCLGTMSGSFIICCGLNSIVCCYFCFALKCMHYGILIMLYYEFLNFLLIS